MSVAVLIPWRDAACKHRERALTWVIAQLAQHGWPVVIGRCDEGPWVKAQAVADALSQTQAEVLVVHDADVWCEGLPRAVEAAQEREAAWAVPHTTVRRLTEEATRMLFTGREPQGLAQPVYTGVPGGGATVIRREVYEGCPLDPRFAGWGQEDHSWGWALRTLHGREYRDPAPLIHLWHPPQKRMNRRHGSLEGKALERRYVNARRDPDAMRRLVEEARPCLSPPF